MDPGTVVAGRFLIREKLGEGGFGTVYRATHTERGKDVALKVLSASIAQDEGARRRFLEEIAATERLVHKFAVVLRESGRDSERGFFYFTMDYIPGPTLAQTLRSGPLDEEGAVVLGTQVLQVLEEAHAVDLLHRDLKPANLILTQGPTGASEVRVLDFGIAKAISASRAAGGKLTRTGTSIGTLAYMSPEQARGARLDGRSDLYALGVVLYEALSGKAPIEADADAEDPSRSFEYNLANTPPLDLGEACRVSRGVRDAVMKALAKKPGDRWESARAFREALEAARAAARAAYPPTARETARATERPSPVGPKRPSTSTLVVRTTPKGAAIVLDGTHDLGVSPLSVEVEPGQHRLLATHDGHEEAELVIDVKRLREPVDLELRPLAGSVVVETRPGGVLVELGSLRTTSSEKGEARLFVVPVGTHEIRGSRAGFATATAQVDVRARSESRVSLVLVASPSTTGTLVVRSKPPGLPVEIDDREDGITPRRVSLPAGSHAVRVRDPEHALSDLSTVEVLGGRVTDHLVDLEARRPTLEAPKPASSGRGPAAAPTPPPSFDVAKVEHDRAVKLARLALAAHEALAAYFPEDKAPVQKINGISFEEVGKTESKMWKETLPYLRRARETLGAAKGPREDALRARLESVSQAVETYLREWKDLQFRLMATGDRAESARAWTTYARAERSPLLGKVFDDLKPAPASTTAEPRKRRSSFFDDSTPSPPAGLPSKARETPAPRQAIFAGIDLGTSNTVVARIDLATGKAVAIPDADGETVTPSVILFQEDGVVVGKRAREGAVANPENVVQFVKRHMGEPDWVRVIDGREWTPETLSAVILRGALRQRAAVGVVDDVVIACPAYFNDAERKATIDAGRLAGLNVLGILNESTAAALAYAIDELSDLDEGRLRALVYDLGGGTFNVTIVEIAPGSVRVLATDGERRLGGKDWDDMLLNHVAEKFIEEHGVDPREDLEAYQELVLRAEEAKNVLSRELRTTVVARCAGRTSTVAVSRADFESGEPGVSPGTKPLLDQTETYLEVVLAKAKLSWNDVDVVLMTGGPTRMPAVPRMLERVSGKKPVALDRDTCVARGAAYWAGYRLAQESLETVPGTERGRAVATKLRALPAGLRKHFVMGSVANVSSHSLGVFMLKANGSPKNLVMIPEQTPLPASTTKVFGTYIDNQATIEIRILEGDSEDPDDCTEVGMCVVSDLPPDRPKGTKISVTYRYSEDGRVEVAAKDHSTGREARTEIRREGVGFSEEQIAEKAREIAELLP